MLSISSRYLRKYSQSRSITTHDYNPGPSKVPKYRHPHSASHLAVSHKRVGAKSQIPKGLSISHMLKLWELQKKGRQTEGITIESFDVSKKIWIQLGEVPFEVTKQHFGQGGCKRAFIASSDNTLFQSKTWLLKYHESSKKIVDELGTDGECQTSSWNMPIIQDHLWRKKRRKSRSFYSFPMGEIWWEFCVTWFAGSRLSPVRSRNSDYGSWITEGGTKSEFYFCLGNLSTNEIHGFMSTHKCNWTCRTICFKKFEDKFV